MVSLRRTLAALLVALTALTATSGVVLAQDLPAGIEREVEQGRRAHPQIVARYGGAYDDPKLQAYVERVGGRVRGVSELAELPFTFTVLDTPVVNAFAVPGGYVYVTRGILALLNDEAELAGVLGHEIGHVVERHGTERQGRGGLLGMGSVLLGTIAGAYLGGEVGARIGGQLGQVAGQGAVQSYSRGQEYESDKIGVRYLARAGYDPFAMGDALEALESNQELQAQLRGRPGGDNSLLGGFFSSHPNTPDRVARADARARERLDDAAVRGDARNRAEYLAAIDGMVYGESPAQGFVRGRRFVHPEMRFAFTAPDGFALQNTPRQVVAQGQGRVIVFDIDRDPGGGLPTYVARGWTGGQVDNAEPVRLGGFEAALGYGAVTIEGKGQAEAAAGVVRGGNGALYRFLLLTNDLGQQDLNDVLATMRDFEFLDPEEAARYRPLRLHVDVIKPGRDPLDYAAAMAGDLPEATLTTLNGLDRGATLAPGDPIKLIGGD